MTDAIDLAAALKARDEGIARVSYFEANMDQIKVQAASWLSRNEGREVIGEDIRIGVEYLGFRPKHPNAWGALIKWCTKKGYLQPTDRYRMPKSKASHARACRIYIVK